MKKTILFMVINMNVGGTEKALLNMLEQMSTDEYDITILMLEEYGGFLNQVPSNVKIQYVEQYKHLSNKLNLPPKNVARKMIREGDILKGISLLSVYLFSKLTSNKNYYFHYVTKTVSKIKNEYDIAVAYAGPMDFISFFVVQKINAKRKIQWIHFDVEKFGIDKVFAKKIYKNFDKIHVVSEEAKRKLIHVVPSIINKTSVYLNVISPEQILKQSINGIGFNDNFTGIRILTVGRLSIEKGQDMAIKVLARLVKEGHNVRWYCVGDGSARNEYERIIAENNLENHFFLLGSDSNPYPYMEQCDLYVQPSRYEGYCLTILEAKILNKVIVATNFNGINEQLKNEETGLIVDINEIELYEGIKKVLTDVNLQGELKHNLYRENELNRKGKDTTLVNW